MASIGISGKKGKNNVMTEKQDPEFEVINKEDYPWPIIHPKGIPKPNFFIPDEFRIRISLHIIKNYIPDLNAPLILAIQGPKGDGKSSQTREVCSQMGAYVVPLSGSSLSGPYEKDSIKQLADAYIWASSVRETVKRMTVLLIDDFDLSVASMFSDRRYTVNTQLLTGFLMNLADNPEICERKQTHRIPIILTGNDFTALHSPLTRHGRMDFFDWHPTLEAKIQIVHQMYDGFLSTKKDKLRSLVEKFSDQPISFFACLKSDAVDEAIISLIPREGCIDINFIRQIIPEMSNQITVDSLFEL